VPVLVAVFLKHATLLYPHTLVLVPVLAKGVAFVVKKTYDLQGSVIGGIFF
jgi:hypothetical protein